MTSTGAGHAILSAAGGLAPQKVPPYPASRNFIAKLCSAGLAVFILQALRVLRTAGSYQWVKLQCASPALRGGIQPFKRSQFSSSSGHVCSSGYSWASAVPCGPFSKMCSSAGTPAFTSAV